jgi:hypothetical protein
MLSFNLKGSLPEIKDQSSHSGSEDKFRIENELAQLDTNVNCLKNINYSETIG